MARWSAPASVEAASGTVTAPLAHRPASSSPGADINTQASDSASALYEACKNEHEPVVEFLLSQGADANKANKDGMLPLHVASKKGNSRSARALSPPPHPHRGAPNIHPTRRRRRAGVREESTFGEKKAKDRAVSRLECVPTAAW